nr:PREDICTED: activin receptor type-2A-like isoform X2 [Bemisia tabaci]
MTILYYALAAFCMHAVFLSAEERNKTTSCEVYDRQKCNATSPAACTAVEKCIDTEPDKQSYCFALWQNDTKTGISSMIIKGCWAFDPNCHNQTRCVETASEHKDMFYCCCEGDMCNSRVYWEPTPTIVPKITAKNNTSPGWNEKILYLLLVVFALSLGSTISYRFFRKKKGFSQGPSLDSSNCLSSSPLMGNRSIQLMERIACGRFGTVYTAKYNKTTVAVKIFSTQDKQLWLTEQGIFMLAHMQHENILHFIGAEVRGNELETQFWLITEYHSHGSLCNYLKGNTITWAQLCKICHSMAKGLMHLHEELPPTKGEGYKPAVAHRDFKSTNVLLKEDLTACIADFNLALIFLRGKPCGDVHGQVGTRRYWAPEVLEGAINFSRDAFLRIDMYACGLVLWEAASRCTQQMGPIPEYRLPFEEEVGQLPCLEDMQEAVVHRRQRPTIPDSWRDSTHKGMAALCETMEECWDHDAEARLSASCVMERIAAYTKL